MYYVDDIYKLIIKTENNKIEELIDYEDDIMGNIYRGRVIKVVKSINAAFVDIGLEDNCYLSLKGIKTEVIEGESILVQVKKIPPEGKAPKLTTELSIKGKNIVYFINSKIKKYSNKLSKNEIKRLAKIDINNVLFRTCAKYEQEEDIIAEYNKLVKIAESIISEKNRLPVPKLIYSYSILKDILKNADEEIITNNKKIFDDYKKIKNIKYEESSLLYKYELLKSYKDLFYNKVELENGSNIVIDRCESLTAVDVNSASNIEETDFEKTAYITNKYAAKEISRQIRLRNISGIIIVDFINMSSEDNKSKLYEFFKKELKKDSSNVKLYGYTNLGLMELSRKNNGEELKNKLKEAIK